MKHLGYLFIAVAASSCGFLIHLFSAEWLNNWISQQMQGQTVTPSWDVKYIALIASIEYGIAAIVIYKLAKEKLHKYSKVSKIFIISALFAAIHGALLRQPVMDYIIGNPLNVVVMQNAFQWLIWLLMACISVLGVDALEAKNKNKQACK